MKISADTFCKKSRRAGEPERQGDKEKRRQGDKEKSVFARLLVSLSPCLFVFFSACGKVGDPLAPIPRAPLHVENLGVEQQGSHLILSFPLKREARAKLQRIDVYRLAEPLDAPMGLPVETFSERASMVDSILADDVPRGRPSSVVYDEAVKVKSNVESKRYGYSVRTYDTAGRANEFSNYATIEPLLNLALPPGGFAAK